MFIQTQETPNPSTLKFLPGRVVMPLETATFQNIDHAQGCPLAHQLLQIPGVNTVFFGTDFVSITKDQDAAWFSLKPLILECLVTYFATHQYVVSNTPDAPGAGVQEDEISLQIRELIDTRVRPAVAMDGGDITFESFQDGVVYVRLQGACAGCPSSNATLKSGIENMLRYYIPEVQEVQAVDAHMMF